MIGVEIPQADRSRSAPRTSAAAVTDGYALRMRS
jgi:hypothetical protein